MDDRSALRTALALPARELALIIVVVFAIVAGITYFALDAHSTSSARAATGRPASERQVIRATPAVHRIEPRTTLSEEKQQP